MPSHPGRSITRYVIYLVCEYLPLSDKSVRNSRRRRPFRVGAFFVEMRDVCYNACMEETQAYITASELSDYVYCKRGWWLRQKGLLQSTQAMFDGTEGHNALFLLVQSLRLRRYIAWALLVIGAFIMLFIILSQL